MHILVVCGLNPNLLRAKLAPLVASHWVDRMTVVARQPGPELPKVDYIIADDHPNLLWRILSLSLAMVKGLRRRPDLLLAYNVMPFGLLACGMAGMTGKPFGVAVIGGFRELTGGGTAMENRMLARFPFLGPLVGYLALLVLTQARFVMTTGTATRDYLVARRLSPGRVHIVASVVETQRFQAGAAPRDIDVLCVSSLIARKRVDRFLGIAAQLRSRRAALCVRVVGDGPLRAGLETLALGLGLQDSVRFLGWIADIRPLLQRSRLFTLTSFAEGLPLSMIESMACGVVPVMARIGDVADLLVDGVNGRLIEDDGESAMADALLALLEDSDRLDCLSRAAVASIAGSYDVTAGVEAWARIRRDHLAGVGMRNPG